MSLFLNKNNNKFISYFKDDIYIDKSKLIEVTNNNIGIDRKQFMCVTRPRRFGKTMAISMLNAYYSKGCDSKEIFDKLNISKDDSYLEHFNKNNVIWLDMASLYTDIEDKNTFVIKLSKEIIDDLKEA